MSVPFALSAQCREVDLSGANPGVYLLLRKDRVVYVGSSICVVSRVGQHVSDAAVGYVNCKQFDRAVYITCKAEERLDYEGALIRYFRPEHNGNAPADNGRDSAILELLRMPPLPDAEKKLWDDKRRLRKMLADRAQASYMSAMNPAPR